MTEKSGGEMVSLTESEKVIVFYTLNIKTNNVIGTHIVASLSKKAIDKAFPGFAENSLVNSREATVGHVNVKPTQIC